MATHERSRESHRNQPGLPPATAPQMRYQQQREVSITPQHKGRNGLPIRNELDARKARRDKRDRIFDVVAACVIVAGLLVWWLS